MSEPTREQICAYLHATGWDVDSVGSVKTCWVRRGQSVFVRHETSDGDLEDLILKISAAEGRHPADTRVDILDVDNPKRARIRAWAISSMCDRAAGIVRRQIEDARDDGWPGVWDWHVADAMGKQAEALATALEVTGALIKAATGSDPTYPWHPLWTAAGHAAGAIVRAEPAKPDDLEEIRRRLAAARIEGREKEH